MILGIRVRNAVIIIVGTISITSSNAHKRFCSRAYDKTLRILISLIIYLYKYFKVVSGIVIIILQESG